MTYQIVYFSPEGHIRTVAEALAEILPEATPCEALSDQQPTAQVQLVGFECAPEEGKQLPPAVTDYLKRLSGKTIFLFAAVPFQVRNSHSTSLHRLAEAALPRECDYLGMSLCPMEPREKNLTATRERVDRNPENSRAKQWLNRQEQAQGHPNARDLEEVKNFARHVLGLKDG